MPSEVVVTLGALLFLATNLVPDSNGFIEYGTKKSPASFSVCLQRSISKSLDDVVEVAQHDGVYRISDNYGFVLEAGKSISTDKTLLRLISHSMVVEDRVYVKGIRRCL